MGMTIGNRLARSNIAMLVIPILAATLLLLLGLGAALLLLRGNLMTLHDAVEQIETVLHGFKLTLSAFGPASCAGDRCRGAGGRGGHSGRAGHDGAGGS